MTDRNSGQHRTTAGIGDSLRWLNVAGETIPAYGVVQLRTNYASGYSQASKPDASTGLFFVNGAVAVPSTKKGESQLWNRPRLALVEGSPAVGDEVGPVDGSWSMTEDGTGYFVIHQPVDGVAAVVQVGSGGGGGQHTMWFVISEVICPDGYEVTQKTLKVVPLWYTGNCGQVPPGQQEDGSWLVYDICGYLEDQVDSELPSTLGRATWFYPYSEDYAPPACVPAWILSDLCHATECP